MPRESKLPNHPPEHRESEADRPDDADPTVTDPTLEGTHAAPILDEAVLEVERRVVKWWHPVLALLALLAIYWIAQALDVRTLLQAMRIWAEELGAQGPVLFVAVYVLLTMLGIPGSWLTLAAGALFGSLVGVLAVIVASTTSCALSFLVARHWMRERVEKWVGQNKRFQKLNRLTERHGSAVVLVVRLLNLLPFAVVNYGFGVTRVRFRTYLLWSFLGKIPGTVIMVVGIDAIIDAIVLRQVPWGLVIIVIVMASLLALTLRTLHHRIQASAPPEDSSNNPRTR
ncbi:TVP38/TMEM64 family protein [Phycisphaerales bacterium AB-hyl4]|uniref:TVP38/TMEM64 family membrane protein n=1 Tax=Natronomicrosphaera hydrolytica TaxID=3242702 RepID=A0ABV4U3D9_9BACT